MSSGGGNNQPQQPVQPTDRRPPRPPLMMPYFDYEPMSDMVMIDAPVLGFGNEALWEDLDERAVRIARRTPERLAGQR